MMTPISPELAGLALAYAERLTVAMKDWGLRFSRVLRNEVAFQTKIAHTKYAESLISNYACLKTFFIRNTAVPLYDFYVPAALEVGDRRRIEAAGLSDVLGVSRRAVITGLGGSGKTIFMRHLLLNSLLSGEKIPVFIELRDLDGSGEELSALILRNLRENGLEMEEALYERLIENGAIAFLLDGFDEISNASRKSVERQIKKLAQGTDCAVIVSSRPDPRFDAWPTYSVIEIASLTLRNACTLIEKVPFDSGLKAKFTAELKASLFAKHRSMLSNPLLLSIMLLTYSESASIPNRITTFYQLAYEALFHRHDALKFGFKRSRKTDLDINQFSMLFSAFCLVTYDERKFKFDLAYAVAAAERACRIANVDVDASDFIDDAREAISLLIDEGLELSFTHRSFQEYFAAKFISSISGDKQERLIRKYADASSGQFVSDRVLDLLYELNPGAIEGGWLIPVLSEVFSGASLTRQITQKLWFEVIKKSFRELELHPHGISVKSTVSYRYIGAITFTSRTCLAMSRNATEYPGDMDVQEFSKKYRALGYSVIRVSEFSPGMAIMKDLATVKAAHSRIGLDLIRQGYNKMLQKESSRDKELDAIFQ